MPFGAEITDRGVRFALWAPSAKSVAVVADGAEHDMPMRAVAGAGSF
jgi:maltooligosyltrehalose trehalohydrolase